MIITETNPWYKETHTNGMLKRLLKKTGFVNTAVITVTGLRAGRFELRFPAWAIFFYNFLFNCSTGHFPGVKGQRREANHLHPPNAQVKKE